MLRLSIQRGFRQRDLSFDDSRPGTRRDTESSDALVLLRAALFRLRTSLDLVASLLAEHRAMSESASVCRSFQYQYLSRRGTLCVEGVPYFCGSGRYEKMTDCDTGRAIDILVADISIAATADVGEGNIGQST